MATFPSFPLFSWENSNRILFLLQKRLFKASYVADKITYLGLQKLILQSNFARLIAIREVTQLNPGRRISGVDGKTSLTFVERFELNEFLKKNWFNWNPQVLKSLKCITEKDLVSSLRVPTISDRVWLCLVKFVLEPTHQAFFHPNNFSSLIAHSVYEVQKILFLSLSRESLGFQRRFLKVEISNSMFSSFDINFLTSQVCAPRSVKLGLFRFFKKGFPLGFVHGIALTSNLDVLLSNILLNKMETLHPFAFRYDNNFICLLRPFDNEEEIVEKLNSFISKRGLIMDSLKVRIFSVLDGFDFLYWHFKFDFDKEIFSTPNRENYNKFLRRIKQIINNSNYGVSVKVNKLYPIIREWKLYNRLSRLSSLKYSLFFVKKRTFQLFNKESKQDFYSSKRLLDKCFSNITSEDKIFVPSTLPFCGHMTFWFDFRLKTNCFCVHCGMKVL